MWHRGKIPPTYHVISTSSFPDKIVMKTRIALTLIFGVFLVAFTLKPVAAIEKDLGIGSQAPALDIEHWIQDGNGFFKPVKSFDEGKVYVVEFWATWCGPCRVEHPFLMQLAAEGVQIHGFNYKDTPGQARAFLDELGDPYTRVGEDRTGRAGIEWGVYGVPETFVINGDGMIVYKHVGPIQNRDLETRIRPAIEAAGG